jgi:hypothetical protein
MEQQTPTGETIPVPKRADVFRDLLKVAKRPAPKPKPKPSGSDGGISGWELGLGEGDTETHFCPAHALPYPQWHGPIDQQSHDKDAANDAAWVRLVDAGRRRFADEAQEQYAATVRGAPAECEMCIFPVDGGRKTITLRIADYRKEV